jgi:hypothetical protein
MTWAIYADSGVGKSTLSATSPNPFFLDSNQGLLSILHRPGFEHVRRKAIHDFEGLESAYRNFRGTGGKNWTKTGTIIFDHFDDIQGQVLDELTEVAASKDPRRSKDETQQREWGIMLNRLRRLLRKYKALPMHKILIISAGEDKITGRKQPAIQGALGRQLPYFCDMIGYLRVRKGKRILSFDELSDDYLAKCRPWWWTREQKRIVIPDVADDPKFLTNLFRSIAAGPGASHHAANKEA